jgi:hypothetical protein
MLKSTTQNKNLNGPNNFHANWSHGHDIHKVEAKYQFDNVAEIHKPIGEGDKEMVWWFIVAFWNFQLPTYTYYIELFIVFQTKQCAHICVPSQSLIDWHFQAKFLCHPQVDL